MRLLVAPTKILDNRVLLPDPSEYRPEYKDGDPSCPDIAEFFGRPKGSFRNYGTDNALAERVKQTYLQMHTEQTVEFVENRMDYWCKFDKKKMTIMEALRLLNTLVDESDPDVDLPNIIHAFQTAERVRQAWPQHDWFALVGLIHDLGKVMAIWGEEQFAVVGDTFPVGCQFADSIVFREDTFQGNADLNHPVYSTKNGKYSEGCGLESLTMSWGHDEYLYRCLVHNKTTIPMEGLSMIRYHSCYPIHTSNSYTHFLVPEDEKTLDWVRVFNKFDLYSKGDVVPDVEALIPYYQSLIDKYVPGVLDW
ncbi:hypothetical protein RvY_07866 [Ramazzottius varieornatus]|uniref:Inositol oxygenase n=1 Tax=Ramazzottius varieornatus TaxID=947166 RepID=A0A1D1V3S5_RAMVA|nr:hypothetical protein RvY_07866 [Ramazzottius varieornatus]